MPVRQVSELRPNPYNKTIFDKSLQENDMGLIYLTEEINRDGLRHPIFCRPDGMIIDGERRWRAITMLGWKTVETIEKDVPDEEVIDYIVRAVSSSRQSTMREQARIYLAYKAHLKATTKLARPERCIQAMQRAHFDFADPRLADMAVTVFQRGAPELQEKLINDGIGVNSAYNLVVSGKARPRLGQPGSQRKRWQLEREKLEKELAAKYEGASKDPEPDDVNAVTGLPATFNDYRLDPLIEAAFKSIVEPERPPEPPKPLSIDELFDEALHKIWMRDKPETTLLRLMGAFANGIGAIHAVDAERAKRCLHASFDMLRPLLKLDKDG